MLDILYMTRSKESYRYSRKCGRRDDDAHAPCLSLHFLSTVVPHPVADPEILLEQILSKVIESFILRPEPIRRRDAAHARHLVHVDQRPAAGEEGVVFAVDEHHAGHDAHVVLPAVAELMPPFALDDLGLVDFVNGPEVRVGFVEEDGLEDVVFVGDRGFVRVLVHAELMLIVGAVERHLDLVHVFGVGMCVVHRSVPRRLSVLSFLFVLREGDLFFLLLVFGLRAEFRVEACLVILFKVLGVGVGDGDVVKEASATENELLAPSGGPAEKLFRIISEDTHDQVVERLC